MVPLQTKPPKVSGDGKTSIFDEKKTIRNLEEFLMLIPISYVLGRSEKKTFFLRFLWKLHLAVFPRKSKKNRKTWHMFSFRRHSWKGEKNKNYKSYIIRRVKLRRKNACFSFFEILTLKRVIEVARSCRRTVYLRSAIAFWRQFKSISNRKTQSHWHLVMQNVFCFLSFRRGLWELKEKFC